MGKDLREELRKRMKDTISLAAISKPLQETFEKKKCLHGQENHRNHQGTGLP